MGVLLVLSKAVLALLSAIFIAVAACCFLVVPNVIFNKILEKTYLGRDSNGTYNELLRSYVNPPYHMKMEIWTQSVANAYNVTKGGAKPAIVQKGPYTFLETQNKVVRFKNGTNDTHLYYRNQRHYFFDQSLSCPDCRLTDQVTVPSLVFQKIVDFVEDRNLFVREMVDMVLRYANETVYTTVGVGDLLFDGYRDPLITTVCEANNVLRNLCKTYAVPERIGLFYEQNNTDDGLYEINTGRADVFDIGRMFAWNGMAGRLNDSYWFGEEARMINGTDSQLFAPKALLKRENFQIFVGQACRSIEMEYQGFTDVQDLPANRYAPAKSMGDVPLQRHMGFCAPNTPTFFYDSAVQLPGCLPAGLMDMGSCVPRATRVYTSNSRFFGAPPSVLAALVGVDEPNAEDDNVFVDIEPLTGVVVRALRRSQINVGVLSGKLAVTSKMRPATIVPMVWMNESVIFDAHTREQLLMVTNVLRNANIAGVASVVVGVALFTGFLLFVVVSGRRARANHELNIDVPVANADVDTSFFDNEAPLHGHENQNFEPSSPLLSSDRQIGQTPAANSA